MSLESKEARERLKVPVKAELIVDSVKISYRSLL